MNIFNKFQFEIRYGSKIPMEHYQDRDFKVPCPSTRVILVAPGPEYDEVTIKCPECSFGGTIIHSSLSSLMIEFLAGE